MVSLPKPDVILTHESDLDGLVAGVLLHRLARQLFGADVRLEAWNYNGLRQRPLGEASAWVTDLTFEARMDRPNWVIIDHHVTESAPKQARLIHDLAKSAGRLCYELACENGLGSPALERLVHLNDVSDLFLEDDPDFILAGDYANLVKIYGFWNLHALVGGEIEKLLDHPLLEVMAAKRRIEDPLGVAWSRDHIQGITPTIGFVETVVGNNNLIVHQLLEEDAQDYQVLVTLMRRANGTVIASLRSRNGEALKVAERLQGGGHANAAAATLPKSVRNLPDAVQYLRQVLNPPKSAPLTNLAALFDALPAVGNK
ncbi:MAG TPA: DHH family phosphoesterase [Verrucomicrobiae bacterium]